MMTIRGCTLPTITYPVVRVQSRYLARYTTWDDEPKRQSVVRITPDVIECLVCRRIWIYFREEHTAMGERKCWRIHPDDVVKLEALAKANGGTWTASDTPADAKGA